MSRHRAAHGSLSLALGLAVAACLAACGPNHAAATNEPTAPASGGSPSAPPPPSSPAASAASSSATTAAGGGSLACLAGTWRSLGISLSAVPGSGGVGAVLTITPSGVLTLDTDSMQPFTARLRGVTESIKFTGTETGDIRVSGNRFSGRYRAGDLVAEASVNGVKIRLPLRKFSHSSALTWESFSCGNGTLVLVAPLHASTWTFTKNA